MSKLDSVEGNFRSSTSSICLKLERHHEQVFPPRWSGFCDCRLSVHANCECYAQSPPPQCPTANFPGARRDKMHVPRISVRRLETAGRLVSSLKLPQLYQRTAHASLQALGAKTMRGLYIVLFVCVILNGTTGLARAGACAEHIRDLRRAAELAHQPTPESISQIHSYGQLMFAAALAQAEAHEVLGREADCLMAVRRAKQMSEIQ
jgi:hypothetical protein